MQAVGKAEGFADALKLTVDHICQTTGWPYGEAWVPDPSGERIVLSGAWSGSEQYFATRRQLSDRQSFAPGDGLIGQVWRSQVPAWETGDAATPADHHDVSHSHGNIRFRERLAIPIVAGEETLAVLVFGLTAERHADPRAVEIIAGVAAQAGILFQLRRSEEMLRQANAELESFAYSVSHDLRAPLRAMGGFSDILLTDYAEVLDETGRDYVKRISRAAQQMATLIDAILSLSRVARSDLHRQSIDLSALAEDVVQDLRMSEPARVVDVRIAPGLTAYGDRRLLRVLLQNLLGNAWKFTGRKPDARIEFGLDTDRAENAFFVRDNGAGFEMAYADKLFRPFQRLHGADEFPGTGVGLATVARIVHRHGGWIEAEGAVDSGTVFRFTL